MSIAVLDDNNVFLREFAQQIQMECLGLGVEAQLWTFVQPEALLSFVREKKGVDIAFVDIVLQNESGIKLAAKLQREFPQMKLLFVTSIAENAVDIFEARPSNFLVKPVASARLKKALTAVLQELENEEQNSVVLQTKGSAFRLRKNDIFYVESSGRQLDIHLADSVVSVYGGMKEMEAALGTSIFRCHRSYLVNLAHVRQINKMEFTLYSGDRVPISRGKQAQAREAFFSQLAGDDEEVGG